MELRLERCTVRSWRADDGASLVRHANNRNVWRNLRDRFPHPYTPANAEAWLHCRLYAGVFEWNPASVRVLEKAGFVCEGRLRRSVVKDGQVIDQFLYAITRA